MPKYLSGKSKTASVDHLDNNRYKYLDISQAEPNPGYPGLHIDILENDLGPVIPGSPELPGGTQYQLVTVWGDKTATRYWKPISGGLIPGSISVYEENALVGTADSITQLDFYGNAITAESSPFDIRAKVYVRPPGENGSVLFKDSNDFATATDFVYNGSVGILTVGTGLHISTDFAYDSPVLNIGVGGSIFRAVSVGTTTLVGIGTTNPEQNLDVKGNIKVSNDVYIGNDLNFKDAGTIIDYGGSGGGAANILSRAVDGIEWVPANQIAAGAAGTISFLQYHKPGEVLGGTGDWNTETNEIGVALVWDNDNKRVGIGSTLPRVLFDVLGNSIFTGITTFAGITTVTGDTLFTKQLSVSGLSTFASVIDANSGINASSAKIEDLTAGRVVFAGTGGEIKDDSDLTFSGTGLLTKNLDVSGISTIGNVKIYDNTIDTISGTLVLETGNSTGVQINEVIFINDTTQSTNFDTGSLHTNGGIGVELNLNVGGAVSFTGPADATGVAVTLAAAGGITTTGGDLYIGGKLYANSDIVLTGTSTKGTVQILEVNELATFDCDIDLNGNLDVSGISTFHNEVHTLSNVGIGTTGGMNDDANRLVVGSGIDNQGITIYSGQNVGDYGSIYFADGKVGAASSRGQIRYEQNNEVMSFYTNNDERLRITKDGDVGIGTDDPDTTLHVLTSNTDVLKLDSTQSGANGANLIIKHTSPSPTDNDVVGTIQFDGLDDAETPNSTTYAKIKAIAKEVSNGSEKGDLVFETRKDATNFTEKLRIASGGEVGIGTTGTDARLAIKKGSGPGLDLIPADDTDSFQIKFNTESDNTNRGFITYNFNDDYLNIRTGGSGEALRIDSSGNVGIGTIDPTGVDAVGDDNTSILAVGVVTANTLHGTLVGSIESIEDLNIGAWIKHIDDEDTKFGFPEDKTFTVETDGTERLRITSTGDVGIGTTSRTFGGDTLHTPALLISGNDYNKSTLALINNATDNNGTYIFLGKQRSGDHGGSIILQDNDNIGQLRFLAADGTDLNSSAAAIEVQVDGGVGVNSTPGRIKFLTTPSGSNTPTERLRITSAGHLLPGANGTQNIGSATTTWGSIYGTFVGNMEGVADQLKTTTHDTLDTGYLTFVDGNNATADGEVVYTSTNFEINSTKGILKLPKTNGGIKFGPGDATNDDAHIEWLGASDAGVLRISTSDDTGTEYIEFGDYSNIGGYHADSQTFTQWLKLDRSGADLTGIAHISKGLVVESGISTFTDQVVTDAEYIGGGKLQVFTTTEDAIDILAFDTDNEDSGRLTFYRNRNAEYNGNTSVLDDDSLGRIVFKGYNDSDWNIGAEIEVIVDGVPGTGDDTSDMPGAILLKTTGDGSGISSERLRITSDGHLLPGDETNDQSQNIGSSDKSWNAVYARELWGQYKGTIDNESVTTFSLNANLTDVFSRTNNTLAAVDPSADKLVFWNQKDSDSELTYASVSDGLVFDDTVLKGSTYTLPGSGTESTDWANGSATLTLTQAGAGTNADTFTINAGDNIKIMKVGEEEEASFLEGFKISAQNTDTNTEYTLDSTGADTSDSDTGYIKWELTDDSDGDNSGKGSIKLNPGTNISFSSLSGNAASGDAEITINAADQSGTTYTLPVFQNDPEEGETSGTAGITLTPSTGTGDTVTILGTGGILISGDVDGGTLTINGDNASGTTYDLKGGGSEPDEGADAGGTGQIILEDAEANTDTVTITAGDNIKIDKTGETFSDGFTISANQGSFAADAFKTIKVSGTSVPNNTAQDDVVADSSTDTLTIVASGSLQVSTDKDNDKILLHASNTNTEYTYSCVDDNDTIKLRLQTTGSDPEVNQDITVVGAAQEIDVTKDNSGQLVIGLSDDAVIGLLKPLSSSTQRFDVIAWTGMEETMNPGPTYVGNGLHFFTNTTEAPDGIISFSNNTDFVFDHDILPSGLLDLGSSAQRWNNIYVNDLQLSNETKKDEGGNDVDGTWGDWTLQEGEENIYMINNRTGKKYAMMLREVE